MKKLLYLTAILSIAGSTFAGNFDWPQWRGPNRDDISQETGLLKEWPSGGPEREWLFRDAGSGYSGIAIANGVLYSMGADDSTEYLFALDSATGERLWETKVGPRLSNSWGDGPRSTPTVDGDHVFAIGGEGNLVCASAKSGEKIWEVSMTDDLGGAVPNWGYTESVLVDGDKVLCTPGGNGGAVTALNKATGDVVWRSKDFKDDAQYSSIVSATIQGRPQYIQRTMTSLVGLDSETGATLWKTDFPGRTAMIPTPIVKDNHVYIAGGYGSGCKMARIDPGFKVTEVYSNRLMKNHHGGVLLLDGRLYGHSDGVGWVCQDFESGEEIWSEKRELGKGAVAYADGRLYCVSEDEGAVVLLEASPEGYNQISRFELSPQSQIRSSQGKIWVHPVVSNGKLYLRDQDLIYCYDIAAN